ncbi:hypothetical protein GOB57_08285 [Sinorhizobium meliloti]|nr:hypothetical protein [Sinorhizobium meliloti]
MFDAAGIAYYGLNDDEAVLVNENGPNVVRAADYRLPEQALPSKAI